MHFDEPGWPLIDDFLVAEGEGRSVSTQRRYARVRDRLHHFLDVGDMTLGLATDQVTLLEAERQFHERGAFWILLGPDELVRCIPSFLQAIWLPDSAADARVQISLVGRLLTHLKRSGLLGHELSGGAVLEAEATIRQARRELAERVTDPPRHATDMPARFLQEPGPEW